MSEEKNEYVEYVEKYVEKNENEYVEKIEEIELEQTAIVPTNANYLVSFSDSVMTDVTEQGYYATFPIVTMDDRKMLFAMRNDNELLRDYMDMKLEVNQFVIDVQTINDPQVGAKNVPCVHILTSDGICYQSASTGVVRSVCDIISSFGLPHTWDEPLKVTCKETQTKNGFRYKYLTVV